MLNDYTTSIKILRRELLGNKDLMIGMHPVLARIYQARHVHTLQHLEYTLKHLHPYTTLSGISTAVEILSQALHEHLRILIIGDFDADGATSTAVAVRALKLLGASHVDYLVPNRFEYGYGLTPEIVDTAVPLQPDLIVTVDNGISSLEGVARAKELGIRVIITDHHLQGKELPQADAIVNPNLQGDPFPSKSLAGVGVIFYVMMALRATLREQAWFSAGRSEPNLAVLLDLVALGTVADVVNLDINNRILVAQGLSRIRSGTCCPGIQALIKIAGRNQNNIVATDLGFSVAPRLNAAGRLQDMSLGIECLLSDQYDHAYTLATQLHALNIERRSIELDMSSQAQDIVNKIDLNSDAELPLGLCLYEASWHQGVIGILASRIKDKLNRPVIVFADSEQQAGKKQKWIKGSARSVKGLHVRDVLEAIAIKYPDLISHFGGHAMAAGLTIEWCKYDEFSQVFDKEVRLHLTHDQLAHTIYTDGELHVEDISLPLAEQIQFGGPWGQGFPEPIFDGQFDLVERRIVGESHLKLRLRVPNSQCFIDGIAFNTNDDNWPNSVKQVKLAYKLSVNEFRGIKNPQFIIEYIQPV